MSKILMALMVMEIGGAETHVLELCKSLAKRGNEVYVVSNGGIYVDELAECGIKHFKAPLHNKKVSSMIDSYKTIKNIIKNNNIEIVHAHARIPAFICGLAYRFNKRKHPFKFVTTAHGVFSTAFPYKLLTDWGEQTLAVSDDLKQYLIENYNISENNILMTVNGIDTEKFSPEADCEELYDELSLRRETKKILNLSRMDELYAPPTYALIDAASELIKDHDVEIIIVGGGDNLENVKARAEAENDKIGRVVIHVTGGRTDANRFFALCDIFVGVSRSALEAMAAAKPVVLAGGQGYVGILNEDTLQAGVDTNFCCRGCDVVTKELVLRDVSMLLNAADEERNELGLFGRELVLANYSVEKMTDDAVELYGNYSIPERKEQRINTLISGYYGSNNHGDDALLKAITEDLRLLKPDISIAVLSLRPKQTREVYGVAAVWRFNFIKILMLLKKTDLLLVGGGTLIQDSTSSRSLFYYLFIINAAISRKVKVLLYSNGIGPVKKPKNRIKAAETLNRVDAITLRDEASVDALNDLGVTNENVAVTADAAFGLKVSGQSGSMVNELGLKGKKYVCISIRSWKHLKDGFENDIAELSRYIYEKFGYTSVFISMQKSLDYEISKRITDEASDGAILPERCLSIEEMLDLIQSAEFVVGMRLHTIIYAAKCETPMIGLVYDPKVKAAMEMFGLSQYVDVADFDAEMLKNYADQIVSDRVILSKMMARRIRELEEKAFSNAAVAVAMLHSSSEK